MKDSELIAKAAIRIIEEEVERIVKLEEQLYSRAWRIPDVRLPKWARVVVYPESLRLKGEKIRRDNPMYYTLCLVNENKHFQTLVSRYTFPPRDVAEWLVKQAEGLPARLDEYIRALRKFRRWLEKVVKRVEKHRNDILRQRKHSVAAERILEEYALKEIVSGGEANE